MASSCKETILMAGAHEIKLVQTEGIFRWRNNYMLLALL